MTKYFIVLIVWLGLIASYASAESFTVFQHKHWEVTYETGDNNDLSYCTAGVNNTEDGISVRLLADTQKLVFFAYMPKWDFEDAEGSIRVWIDSRSPWKLEATGDGKAIFSTLPSNAATVDFLTEIIQGSRLYVSTSTSPKSTWDIWVSLNGSTKAVNALMDCKEKLGKSL